MTRPLWLLDVDGVLNANRPGWGAAPRRTQVLADGVFWKLRWAPALIERIWALHRTGAVEIRWATSWIGNTDKVEAALHLPHFESAYEDPAPGRAYAPDGLHAGCKLAAAMRAIAEQRRLIWTDDDAIPSTWLARPDDLGDAALLIAPRPNRGLQPADMDAIGAFIGLRAEVAS
jgi:hypothetical protein